jgi:hypothetical protein
MRMFLILQPSSWLGYDRISKLLAFVDAAAPAAAPAEVAVDIVVVDVSNNQCIDALAA